MAKYVKNFAVEAYTHTDLKELLGSKDGMKDFHGYEVFDRGTYLLLLGDTNNVRLYPGQVVIINDELAGVCNLMEDDFKKQYTKV